MAPINKTQDKQGNISAIPKEECKAQGGIYWPLLADVTEEFNECKDPKSPLYRSEPRYCEAAKKAVRDDVMSGNSDGCSTLDEYRAATRTGGEESERYFAGHKILFEKVTGWLGAQKNRTAELRTEPITTQVLVSESGGVTRTEATRIDMVEELLRVINVGYLVRDLRRADGGIKQFWDLITFGRYFFRFSSFIPDGPARRKIEEDDSMTGLWKEWAEASFANRERAATKFIEELKRQRTANEAAGAVEERVSNYEQCAGPVGWMFFECADEIVKNDYPLDIVQKLLTTPAGDTKTLGTTLLELGAWLDNKSVTDERFNWYAAQYIYEVLIDNHARVGLETSEESAKRVHEMYGRPGERSPFWNFMFPELPWNYNLLSRAEQQSYAEDILTFSLFMYVGGKATDTVLKVVGKAHNAAVTSLARKNPRLSGLVAVMSPTFGQRTFFGGGNIIYGNGATGFSGKIALTRSALVRVESAEGAIAGAESAIELYAARDALQSAKTAFQAANPALEKEVADVMGHFAPRIEEARKAVINAKGREAAKTAKAALEAVELQAAREALPVAKKALTRLNADLAGELDATLERLAADILKGKEAMTQANAALAAAKKAGGAASKEALEAAETGLKMAKAGLNGANERFNVFADNAFRRFFGWGVTVDGRFVPMVMGAKKALLNASTQAEIGAAKAGMQNIRNAVYNYVGIQELTTRINVARWLIAIAARKGETSAVARSALQTARTELGSLLNGIRDKMMTARASLDKTAIEAAKAEMAATDAMKGFSIAIREAKRDALLYNEERGIFESLAEALRAPKGKRLDTWSPATAELRAVRSTMKETVKAHIGGGNVRYWGARGVPAGLGNLLSRAWDHTAGALSRLIKGVEPLAERPQMGFFRKIAYDVNNAMEAVVLRESRGGFRGVAAYIVAALRPTVNAVANDASKGLFLKTAVGTVPRPSWLVATPFRAAGAALRFVSKGPPVKWKYGLPPWWYTVGTGEPSPRGFYNPLTHPDLEPLYKLKGDLRNYELDWAIQEIAHEAEARELDTDGRIFIKELDLERFDEEYLTGRGTDPADIPGERYQEASGKYEEMVDFYYGLEPENARRHFWEISRREAKRRSLTPPETAPAATPSAPQGPVSSANILHDLANDPVWSELGFVYMGEGGTFESYEGDVTYMGPRPELKEKDRPSRVHAGMETADIEHVINNILAVQGPSLFADTRQMRPEDILASAAAYTITPPPFEITGGSMNFYLLEKDGHRYLIGVPQKLDEYVTDLLG